MSGACGDGRSRESRSISMGKSRDMSWFGLGMSAWLIVIPRRRYNVFSRGMGKRCRLGAHLALKIRPVIVSRPLLKSRGHHV